MALTALELEKQRNKRLDDVFSEARERRIRSQFKTALADPGRYAPQVYQAARRWQDNVNEFQKQADILQNRLDLQDKVNQGLNDVEKQRGLNAQEIARLEHGYRDANGNFIQGSRERMMEMQQKGTLTQREKELASQEKIAAGEVQGRKDLANIQGEWSLKTQTEANKAITAKNEIEQQRRRQEIEAKIKQAQISAGAKVDAASTAAHSKMIEAAISAGATQGKDAKTSLAELAEANKDNPALLASIKAVGGETQANTQQNYPGYNPEQAAELIKRSYKWDGSKFVK